MTQIEMGKDIEQEHEPTYNWLKDYVKENKKLPPASEMYKHIAEDHLDEIDDYYTQLMKAKL